jgi:tripartite-type tricarboxylate transporter receptor subunit TctC
MIWEGMMQKLFLVLASLCSLLLLNHAYAQDYPSRPVHLIIGFGTGGPDTTARIIAAQLATQTGKRFVVENKPGSSGIIGAEFVAKSAPDGYTLLVSPASLASLPSLQTKLPFNIEKDFRAISQIVASEASFLLVYPKLPVKNLKEFMGYIKDGKNRVLYGSTGIGTGSHLRMALFAKMNNLPMQHVPFKSPGEAAVSLIGGETHALFMTTTQALPLIKSGKALALAYDYPTRADFMAEIPTMAEAGAAPTDLDSGWHGIMGPAGMPDQVVAWLENEVRKAIANPEVKEKLVNLGLIPVGSTGPEFQKVIVNTIKGMGDAARAAGIEAK